MIQNSVEFFANHTYSLPPEILPPIIIGWKISTPQNIGSMLRLSDTVRGNIVYIVDNQHDFSLRKIRKTAGDSYHRVELKFISEEEFFSCIPEIYNLLAVETAETSTNLFSSSLPNNVAIMVGSEKNGIPPHILKKIEKRVHIPIIGSCKSLNVTHALSITLYEWLRQNLSK